MFAIRVRHDHPSVMDEFWGPYNSIIGAKKDLANQKWSPEGVLEGGICFVKNHPRQGWKMRAYIEEMRKLES